MQNLHVGRCRMLASMAMWQRILVIINCRVHGTLLFLLQGQKWEIPVLNLHHPHPPSSGTLRLLWNALSNLLFLSFLICSFYSCCLPSFLSSLKYSCSPHYSQPSVHFLLYLPLKTLLTLKGSTTTSELLTPRPLFPPLVHLSRQGTHCLLIFYFISKWCLT